MGYQRFNVDQWEKPPWEFKIGTFYDGRFIGFNKFGINGAINNATFDDIWSPGGNLSFLTSAEPMEIASDNAADTLVGTGAQKLKIFGVGDDYEFLEEEIDMDGINVVTTVNSYLRISRMIVTDVGTAESNVGTITAFAQTAASIQAQVDEDLGQTAAAITTVPKGFFAFITHFDAAVTGGDSGIVDFQTREFNQAWRVRQRTTIPSDGRTTFDFTRFKAPIVVSARSDVKMRAIKDGGGGSAGVTASFDYYLIDIREINIQDFDA